MKKIGLGNYKDDRYYPKVVKAVGILLQDRDEIATVDILLKMGIFFPEIMKTGKEERLPISSEYFKEIYQKQEG